MSKPAVVVVCSMVLFLVSVSALSQSEPSRQEQLESHARQAAADLRDNKLDLAAQEFKAILALDPKNVDARGNLGVVLFFQGEYTNAIPQLRAALKLQPALSKIQALLGMAERRTDAIDSARRDLEGAFPKVQDKKIRIEAGMDLIDLYSAAGELDKAGSIVGELRRLEPTDESLMYTAYRLYSDLADESLLSLSVVAPNSARMHQALAHELAKRGNTAEAIENYRAALKLDPQLPGLHFELADMLRTFPTPEARQEAESEYKAALQVNPLDEQSECRLADIALQRDDVKEADERYTRALQLRPNDPEASIGLAKVYMTMDQPQKAEPLLLNAIKLDPTSSLAHFRLSTVYRLTGHPEDAKHEFDEYQKYKDMKDKLQAIYHDLHSNQGVDENEDSKPKK
jgi:Tfp pilus assembly protein PilF